MSKQREELRRGIRSFIQDASAELAEFANPPHATTQPESGSPDQPPFDPSTGLGAGQARDTRARTPASAERPILRLVRDAPAQTEPSPSALQEMTLHLPRKGVCAAYFVNKRCWELPDAYCNHALHICRLRECPVYDLHREEMERRFAAKFKHLW